MRWSILSLSLLIHLTLLANVAYPKTLTISVDYLNVRSGPGLNYGVVQVVEKNHQFVILDEQDGWYQISVGGTVGWVSEKAVVIETGQRGPTVELSPKKPDRKNEAGLERRVALVIGNSDYENGLLLNPVHDAEDMATTLRELGFQVIFQKNVDQSEMYTAIRKFGDELKQGGVGLFYFAGHGMQVNGRNYLIPVKTDIQREDEVPYKAVDAGVVLSKMESAGNALNMVILDACRNNPFARSFRASVQGLAQMDAPSGTLIVYATSPGSVALDGSERNGIFTKHLLAHMKTPGLEVGQMLRRVRTGVREETKGQQIPWESSSLEGSFYFVPPEPTETPPTPAPQSIPVVEDIPRQRIQELLARADVYFTRQWYTTPEETNAFDLYQEVLRLDPANEQAHRQLDKMAAFYKSRAEREVQQGRVEKAIQYYRRYLKIVPDDEAVLGRVIVLEDMEREKTGGSRPSEEKAERSDTTWTGMGRIPAGFFRMGSENGDPDEKPVHEVYLDSFYMDKYEVTVGAFRRFDRVPDCEQNRKGDNYPVVCVTWDEAKAYCEHLGKRLPTEAEWEKAARGGLEGVGYPWGDHIDFSKANYDSRGTKPVGSYPPNGYGLYDMAGNVWEWVADWYAVDYYLRSPARNPVNQTRGEDKVSRGSSWFNDLWELRVSRRIRNSPWNRLNFQGFRCARDE